MYRDESDIIDDVIDKIQGILTQELFDKIEDRIIFAISVESIECWILPLQDIDPEGKKWKINCESHLQRALNRKGVKYFKNYDTYKKLVKGYKRKNNIEKYIDSNVSFSRFIRSLPVVG